MALETPSGVLGSIFDVLPNPVFVKDEQHRWVLLNDSFCRFMGYEREQLLGKSDYDLYPKNQADVFWSKDDVVFATGAVNENEERATDSAGHEHVILTRKTLFTGQNGRRFLLGTITDITERKLAERALKASETRYRRLFEAARDGVLVLDADNGRIVDINPFVIELTGYSREHFLGERLWEIDPFRDLAAYKASFTELQTQGYVRYDDLPLEARDGTMIDVELVSNLYRVDDQGVIQCTIRDVTGRKRAERESLRARAERDKMTAQLMQADRMISIGILAAGVAHEINNPLAYLIAALDFLDEELKGIEQLLPGGQWKEVDEALAEAREGAGRVKHVVRDLKTFSRVEEVHRGRIDLRPVIESSINMAFNEIKFRARLVKDYGTTPPVLADEARLGQVFLNLLINAAQAIPEGHVDRNEIRVVTRTDDLGRAIVEVRDSGSGIPPDVVGRIFDPFFTTKPTGVGSGLGLSICRNIVTTLGGEIAVESELNKGTVFRVALPPALLVKDDEGRPSRVPVKQGRRGRVLVVDDERAIGESIRRLLRSEHEVVVLTSADEARDLIAGGERFDVILCDLMLPTTTGMDLHAALVTLAPDQAENVVLLTGGAFTLTARHFLEAVPNLRIEKPFDAANLRAIVRGLVR